MNRELMKIEKAYIMTREVTLTEQLEPPFDDDRLETAFKFTVSR